MKKERIAVVFIIAAILAMVLYNMHSNTLQITEGPRETETYGREERRWLAINTDIYVYIPQELEYLNNEKENLDGSFLQDYLSGIGRAAGFNITVAEPGEETEKDSCRLVVMTEERRQETDQYSFTLPILTIKGSLFITSEKSVEELSMKESLQGVCVKNTLTQKQKKSLYYNKAPIELKEFHNVEEAVEYAEEHKLDCILGDEAAIFSMLGEIDLENRYRVIERELYEQNVCFAVEADKIILYKILNDTLSIYMKESGELRNLQGKWFGMPYSMAQESNFSDFAILILIVFTAMLCAFFLYYQTNKNLYDELTERMNQLSSSQREMATTFNGVPYYMAELDPEGHVLAINKAMNKFLGNREMEVTGAPIFIVMGNDEEQRSNISQAIVTTAASGTGQSFKLTQHRQILDIKTFPIENNEGKIEKILFMASDVTGVKAAERQMLQDNKMIAVGQLMAGIAHEIKNPLGLIRNCCYILKTADTDGDRRASEQALQVIEKSVESSGKIIDNLLNFSRISNYEPQQVWIKKHIENILLLNHSKIKVKKINVNVFCKKDFCVNIYTEAFEVIFMNLLSNAIDAISGENGKITVYLGAKNNELVLAIRDNGTGIGEHALDEIFNPFFTTKEQGEGTGLGLYIVYNEVQKLNGHVEVENKLQQGTQFTVIFPMCG